MKLRRALFLVIAGLCVHCSSSRESQGDETPGNGIDDISAQHQLRTEYVCSIPGDKVLRIHPSFGEIHRIDSIAGTWEMTDGLAMTPAVPNEGLAIQEEGELIASIDADLRYKEGAIEGTCERFDVKQVPFSDVAFQLEDGLEYNCRLEGGRGLIVRPSFGEIDEIDMNEGKFLARDGMDFKVTLLKKNPPINEIRGTDDEGGAVGTISEDARGATWRSGSQTGPCTKSKRVRR